MAFWKQDKVKTEIQIDPERLPRHIAIIMDGNGRWAQRRGLPRSMGHRSGVEALRGIVKACGKLKVEVLTVYAFSTENWRRPKDEVDVLMSLLAEYLRKELPELLQNNVQIRTIGKISELPAETQREIAQAIARTEENSGLVLNIALNYGSRSEILDAVRRISQDVAGGRILMEEINEEMFSETLYTHGLRDPDLLIRTSGEMRISNFLLWQLAYTEIVVVPELWPDFTEDHLLAAIKVYQGRERRFGGIHSN